MKTIHIKLILFLVLCPLCSLAQSSGLKMMSDSIFENAVQLYHQKDYHAAIREFQKCDAIDEQYMDPVLNRREYARDWMSRCYYLLGDEEQAKTLSNYYRVEPVDRKLTEISDSLAIIAAQYSMNADYANALKYGLECLEKELLLIGDYNYITANSYYFIADCYGGLNDFENAVSYCKKSLSIRQQVLGDQSIDYLSSLYILSTIYYITNEPDSTIKYGTKAKELYSKLIGTNDEQYCDLLVDLYYSYIDKKDSSNAIQTGEEMTLLVKELKGINSEDYYLSLNSLANQYLDIDNSRVLEIREELKPLIKTLYGHDSEAYVTNLDILSQLSYETQDYNNCVIYGQELLTKNSIHLDLKSTLRTNINVAFSYMNLDDYHSAIIPLLKVNEFLGDTSSVYVSLLAMSYAIDGNYQQASVWIEKYIKLLQDEPSNVNEISDALDIQSSIYQNAGYYLKALEGQKKAIEYLVHNENKNLIDKVHALNRMALIYYRLGYGKEAIQYGEDALEIINSNTDIQNDSLYALIYNDLGLYYSECGEYEKAISSEMEALKLYEKSYGLNHPYLISPYTNLSAFYQEIGEYDTAINYIKKVLELREQEKDTINSDYGISLNNYAWILYLKGEYPMAKQIYEKALSILQSSVDSKGCDYAIALSSYANLLARMGDYSQSAICHKKALAINKQALGLMSKGCGESMNNLASYYSDFGDYKTALLYSDSALYILKNVVGELHPSYASSLSNLALIQADNGDYKAAINNAERVCEIKKQLYGIDGYNYITSLGNLATFYSYIGDYQHALKLKSKVEEAERKILGVTHPNYLTTLNNLAVEYSNTGNITKAFELSERVLLDRQKYLGANHPDCANTLCNLALFYERIKNYDQAIEYAESALAIYQSIYGENHPNVAWCISTLAHLYLTDNIQQSLMLDKKALDIRKSVFGDNNLNYFLSQKNVARDFFFLDDYNSAWDYEKQCCFGLKNYFCNNLYAFNSFMRESFWLDYSYIFDSDLPFFCFYAPDNIQETGLLYDYSALFSKGLLLNLESGIRKRIMDSNDSTILRRFSEVQQQRSAINRLYELPINERFIDVDSLEQVVKRQENELLNLSQVYVDYTKTLNITWEDVQKSLGDHDIAIEFLSFRARNDSVMYVALTVDRDDSIPKMTTLFEKKQMDSISANDYYTTSALYHLIWSPLEKELEGKENVYFSPAGALYNTGIEYLPINDSENIADKYNLVRLSSTRELVMRRDEEKPTKAALYGGLLYNIDPEIIHEDNLANGYRQTYSIMTRGLEDSLNTRSDFNALSSTLREVENIDNLLSQNDLSTKLYTRYNGTEESFKDLDGKGINILHLATHGAYIPDSIAAQKKDEKNYRFIRLGDEDQKAVYEDQSLTRSFLVMSGGNMLIHGDSIPNDIDDGILTAQEISRLNLSGLNLVVLSACETALGDITNEGVMGLQRGFKKAGAQTIVMSLWKVADEQTQQFMTEFYRLLTNGIGKRQAFKTAQKYMRSQYPEQRNKPYWAAFIMLD